MIIETFRDRSGSHTAHSRPAVVWYSEQTHSEHLERVGLEAFREVHGAARRRALEVEWKRVSQQFFPRYLYQKLLRILIYRVL